MGDSNSQLKDQQRKAQELAEQLRGKILTKDLTKEYTRDRYPVRVQQTIDICTKLRDFIEEIAKNIQIGDDPFGAAQIRFAKDGQIESIFNALNPEYRLSSDLLAINQDKNNSLTNLEIGLDKRISGINTNNNEPASFYNISCDKNNVCTCTFNITRETTIVRPKPPTKEEIFRICKIIEEGSNSLINELKSKNILNRMDNVIDFYTDKNSYGRDIAGYIRGINRSDDPMFSRLIDRTLYKDLEFISVSTQNNDKLSRTRTKKFDLICNEDNECTCTSDFFSDRIEIDMNDIDFLRVEQTDGQVLESVDQVMLPEEEKQEQG